MRNKLLVIASLVIIASMVLSACAQPTATTAPQPAQPGVTQVVQTSIVKETQVVKEIQVVTATAPPPAPAKEFKSADPTTLVYATIGDQATMDPALAYDTASGNTIQNTYETLIFYDKEKAADFVPMLATEVPTKDNGGISADGKSFTFKIRPGVKFHNGDPMTPSDVAYSLQRGLLQGGPDSPQFLLTEPFFGVGMQDISAVVQALLDGAQPGPLTTEQIDKASGTALLGDAAGMQAVDPKVLKQTCEWVSSLIVADDAKGTVTLNLATPWGPLLATLANTWGSVMDKKWVGENKGWDGSCDTWQNFYAVTPENNPLNDLENGTGPYVMSAWVKGQEIDMTAFDGYWRTDPAWEGGPTGVPKIKNVITKIVPEWGTRFAMLQAGDADLADVPRQNTSQIMPLVGDQCVYDSAAGTFKDCVPTSTPDQPLRVWLGHPGLSQTTIFFNQKINTDGGNPYIGSGKLDGKGIPPDFFSDVHVRKAFNYCFNWDQFIKDALVGEAVQSFSLPLPGMPGYADSSAAHYTYDLDKCKEEFAASTWKSADGKSLNDVGFRTQFVYNSGNVTRQTAGQILASGLAKANSKFVLEVLQTPWPTLLSTYQKSRLPVWALGWQEDIHDAHNWYAPYLTGTYGRNSNFAPDLAAAFTEGVNKGVAEVDPAKRDAIYQELNKAIIDQATIILLAIPTVRNYAQRWVDGWYYNPMFASGSNYYFYALSKQ